jgi:hypothetical protein
MSEQCAPDADAFPEYQVRGIALRWVSKARFDDDKNFDPGIESVAHLLEVTSYLSGVAAHLWLAHYGGDHNKALASLNAEIAIADELAAFQ